MRKRSILENVRADPQKKLRVIDKLSNLKLTDQNVVEVLQIIADETEGNDDLRASGSQLSRKRMKTYGKLLTTISLPSEDQDGELLDFKWKLCAIDKLLKYFVSISSWYRDIMACTVRAHGPILTPIVYYDEVTPGNAFAPDNKRKAWCIYVSFLEFGPELLQQEFAWLPLAILRSTKSGQVVGGISCVVKLLLLSWFPSDALPTPIALPLENLTIISFTTILHLADLDAHKYVAGWKGASGIHPCVLCRNCLRKSHPAVTKTSYLVDTTCTEFERFDLAKDDDVYELIELLRDHDSRGENIKNLEQAHGVVLNHHGIINEPRLRKWSKPISSVRLDPMHCMYVGGVLLIGLSRFLQALRKYKYTFEHIRKFMEPWTIPSGKNIDQMFSDKRERAFLKKKSLKADASELLAVYPVLRAFASLMERKHPKLKPNCACLYALCDLTDALQEAKGGNFADRAQMAEKLRLKISTYLKMNIHVYGTARVTPKHHMLMHLVEQFLKDGFLMDCFVTERMHILAKRTAEKIQNTIVFELSVILRILHMRAIRLTSMYYADRLVAGKHSSRLSQLLGSATQVSRCLVLKTGQAFKADQVILVGDLCYLILACFVDAEHAGLIVEELHLQEQVDDCHSQWRRLFHQERIRIRRDIFETCFFDKVKVHCLQYCF